MNKNQNLLNLFLIAYFYKIESDLNMKENGIETLKFQSEEANTDEHLKKYFQVFLKEHNDLSGIQLKKIVVIIDSKKQITDVENLKSYKITDVLLPEQLDLEQKKHIAESKKSVYTNPDLYLKITDGTNDYFESIELKSTKDNNIPGSSIQQVSPFEWVIFVKRDIGKVLVTTGFYINSITEKLPFPDRSPRPQVSFKTLLDWNRKYRKVENEVLTIENVTKVHNEKIKLLTDWQEHLAAEWLEIIKSEENKNNEKWFNKTIRKFSLYLIDYINTLTESEKEKLRNNLTKFTK